MSRSSPGVRRIVSVLNFFADHPGESFTLTDIVRALHLSRATCHGLLTGLVEAGYLYRSSDKTYLLGPALVAIGEIAKEHFSPLRVALPEMRALADDFDVNCMASFREHSDVVIRHRAASRSHVGYSVPIGTRLPLLSQFASIFFTRANDAYIDDWMDNLQPKPSDHQRELLNKSVAFAREHGFCLAVNTGEITEFSASSEWILKQGKEAPLAPLMEYQPDGEYNLSWIGVPVLDGNETIFALTLQGFPDKVSGRQIEEMAERLKNAARRIGGFVSHPVP